MSCAFRSDGMSESEIISGVLMLAALVFAAVWAFKHL
jgi:hypothetical protein